MVLMCRETDPNWDLDIGNDVKDECQKFGPVQHHYVDKNSKVRCNLHLQCRLFCWHAWLVTNREHCDTCSAVCAVSL